MTRCRRLKGDGGTRWHRPTAVRDFTRCLALAVIAVAKRDAEGDFADRGGMQWRRWRQTEGKAWRTTVRGDAQAFFDLDNPALHFWADAADLNVDHLLLAIDRGEA